MSIPASAVLQAHYEPQEDITATAIAPTAGELHQWYVIEPAMSRTADAAITPIMTMTVASDQRMP